MKTKLTLFALLLLVLTVVSCAPQETTAPDENVLSFVGFSKYEATASRGFGDVIVKVECNNCTATIVTNNRCPRIEDPYTKVIKDGDLQTGLDFNYLEAAGVYQISASYRHKFELTDCSNRAKLVVIMNEGGTVTELP